jgi:hypothetical protein
MVPLAVVGLLWEAAKDIWHSEAWELLACAWCAIIYGNRPDDSA